MKKILILLLLVFLFSGCGIWNDFTTYFNIYYDTADSFNQAEQLIKQHHEATVELAEKQPAPDVKAMLYQIDKEHERKVMSEFIMKRDATAIAILLQNK